MTAKKQIPLSEAVGLTLTGSVSSYCDDSLVLMFGDVFVCLHAERGWEESVDLKECEFDWRDFGVDRSIEAELITQAEIDAYYAKQEQDRAKLVEARERAEFERLRAKYEGKV